MVVVSLPTKLLNKRFLANFIRIHHFLKGPGWPRPFWGKLK